MPQILGRDALIARIGAALERAGRAGGGTVIVSGPAGAGTTAAVAEALRLRGAKAPGASAAPPTSVNAPALRIDAQWMYDVQWIDDVQRAPDPEALARALLERSSGATDAATGVVVLSGRAPWGAALATLQRAAMRADPMSVLDVPPLAPEVAVEIVTSEAPPTSPREHPAPAEAAIAWARACGSRLRLLAAVLRADGDLAANAVGLAVDDLVADLSPNAHRLLEVIAVGAPDPRTSAVEGVWARESGTTGAGFDETLAELVTAGFIGPVTGRLRCAVPVVCAVIAARLGAGRGAMLHVAYVEVLSGLGGVDPREIAEHVRPVADRLPVDVAATVLTASAQRRTAASDHLGAVADLAVAAELREAAATSGSAREGAAAFDALSALGAATYYAGDLDAGERMLRRAERFTASASPGALAELELFRTYIRADRGQPSEIPKPLHETRSQHPVDGIVIRLFLVDRGDDQAELEAVCDELVALDRDDAGAIGRGGAALGRSVRASLASDLDAALAEAEWALSVAGDTSATLYGGIERELIRLCVLKGDLDAALRHADGDGYDFAGRVPRIVEASNVVHAASVALLQGDIADATERAERALTMTRLAPVPRGLVRCVAWVALLSAMRGDRARARSLLAEAGRAFPLDGNLRLGAIVQLARVQLALRDGGPVPPVALRLERTEGSARLLLPVLLARLGLQAGDDATVDRALAELDQIGGSPPADALAERIRALRLVPTRHRREAADRLGASAAELERLGFRGLAAETRLEWAELAAEAADPAARVDVVDLVRYFDAQGLDDWGDRARRLARTLGVRVGGRRGGTDQLTRREAEVVELVVDGMSNAEVARRLFLSERTVETHLQHVYRRLGVDSRLGLVTRLGAPGDAASHP